MKKRSAERSEPNRTGPKRRQKPRLCVRDEYGLHPDNPLWGGALREIRLARLCSLTALAEATGLKRQGLRKIEDGRCCPKLDSVLRICEARDFPIGLVALLVELRREGTVVPIAQVLHLRRRQRRILWRMADCGGSTQAAR